ncbi:MAG: DUF4142 domain-containing protein [Pseudomonadota bacterium]
MQFFNIRPASLILAMSLSALAAAPALAQTSGSGTSSGSASSGSAAGSGNGGKVGTTATPGGSTGSTGTAGAAGTVAAADKAFINKAAGSGLFEVEVSKLAADKASSPDVKRYASMLVDEHTKANSELTSLASSKGVTPPTSMPADKRRIVDRLSRQTGSAFDKEYMQSVGIKAHQEDVKLFQNASRSAKDAEVKSFAAKTLPSLQQHLAEAQKMPMTGGASSNARSSTSGTGSTSGMSSSTGSTSSSTTK